MAVRYDLSYDPERCRWYCDASWKTPARPVPSLEELRASPVVAVDVNVGHLAVAVIAPDGNVMGTPFTIPFQLTGLSAAARDGRVRAAVSAGPSRASPPPGSVTASCKWKPTAPRGTRQPPGTKTGPPQRITAGIQATQDRSGPPTGQYSLLRGG